MSTFLKRTSTVVTVLVGAIALFILGSLLPLENGYTFRVVESGSMEPTIKTGSVIATIPREQYVVGDIVTFTGKEANAIPTTHRIVDTRIQMGQKVFVTQGDANNDVDYRMIEEDAILGALFLSVPYAGYLVRFVQTTMGFVLLVIMPLIFIAGSEVYAIVKRTKK